MERILSTLLIALPFWFSTLCTRAAQVDFMPVVSNFTQMEYNGGMQNWSITQAANGVMYFGNNKGLLAFDGYRWTLLTLPGKSVVRSVLADADRVYVGTYTDFGYFAQNKEGKYVFTSLWPAGYQPHNDEIWKIIKAPNGHIYFQSFCSWFDYDGKRVVAHYNPEKLPLYFFPVSNEVVYVQMMNGGLAQLRHNSFVPILPRATFANDDIVGMASVAHREILIATARNGLYTWKNGKLMPRKTSIDNELKQNQINKICFANASTLVVGTLLNGVYAIDMRTGDLLWHYNMENSLKNNTVLGLMTDKSGNVWVALDNGISLIHTALPLTVMRTDKLKQPIGMVYGIAMQKPYMYIATNQALWQYHLKRKEIHKVSNSNGQNWHVFAIDNRLFAGHNLHTLAVQNTQATPLTVKQEGSTGMRRHRVGEEDIIIEAGYNHLNIYKKQGESWVWSHAVQGFQAPILGFEVDNNGTIWASHFSKGLYQIELSKDFKKVTYLKYHLALEKNDVQSKIHVMKIRGRLVFSYQGKLYTYDDLNHKIVAYNELSCLELQTLTSAAQVDNTSFWLADEQAFTLAAYDKSNFYKRAYIPYSTFGLEVNTGGIAMYADGQDTYFYLNNGIGHYDILQKQEPKPKFPLTIAEVTSTNEKHHTDTLSSNSQTGNRITSDNVRIVLSYPNFNHQQFIFDVTLEGGGKTIKTKQENPVFTFQNLGYGNYQLHVKVLDGSGKVIASTQYRFEHPTPFYLSVWAILLYLLVLYFVLKTYTSWRTHKIVQENKLKAEKELMEKNLKVLEQKHIIARQQQIIMENELTNKGKELASMALQIATHSSKTETLRDELLEKKRKGQLSVKDFEKLIAGIDSSNDTEMWNVFQQNFDLIHKNFFRNLRRRYPELTPADLKFCALLRLNYSTKDIAKFTRLTVRGVEGARYRIRKKLGIKNDQSLTDFLIELC